MKLWLVLLAGTLLVGCEEAVFDTVAAQGVLESGKLPLSGEQVLISPDEVTCGQKKGLWEVEQIPGAGATGRLTDAGRAVGFGDDVRMGDRRFSNPTVQLRGDFPVKASKIESMSDTNPGEKILEAKVGVVISHECFAKPLPLLGINRGDFSEEVSPRIHLTDRGGWKADQVLH